MLSHEQFDILETTQGGWDNYIENMIADIPEKASYDYISYKIVEELPKELCEFAQVDYETIINDSNCSDMLFNIVNEQIINFCRDRKSSKYKRVLEIAEILKEEGY